MMTEEQSEPERQELGTAVSAVLALYESAFKDACVIDCAQDKATAELGARCR